MIVVLQVVLSGVMLIEQVDSECPQAGIPNMNTALSPLSSQPELFPLAIMAQHGCLLPATSGLTPYAQRTIRRATTCWINICASPVYPLPPVLLPVTGFGYIWQDKNGKCLWCSISITSTVYWRVKCYLPVRLTMSRSILER